MSIIPCGGNQRASDSEIDLVAEKLKTEAHSLGGHSLSEKEFYSSGLFRSAIERIRGQFSATMGEKREFVKHILNHMQDNSFIADWESAGASNRHDYEVTLNSGNVTAIELKGCLDGNNTTIFERPPNATEFVIWSICNNVGSNIEKNVWSGIHTRLGPDIIAPLQIVGDAQQAEATRTKAQDNLASLRMPAIAIAAVRSACIGGKRSFRGLNLKPLG